MPKYRARCPLRIDLAGFHTSLPTFAQTEGYDLVAASVHPYVEGRVAIAPDGSEARWLRPAGNRLAYRLDTPPHAGLGASAARTALWVTLVRTPHRDDIDRLTIAHLAQDIDTRLDNPAPWADYVACVHGGLIRCRRLQPEAEVIETAGADAARFLSETAILVYVPPARTGRALMDVLEQRLLHGDRHIWDTLRTMKLLSGAVWGALHQWDVGALAEAFRANWLLQTQLSPDVSTPEVETALRVALHEGALAGKLCGFGGGSLLLLAAPGQREALEAALRRRRLHLLRTSLDSYGLHFSRD